MAKETIGTITKAEVAFALARLDAIHAVFTELHGWLNRTPAVNELWVFRYRSLNEGLQKLEAVCPELRRSIHSYASGKPIGPDSSKSRVKPKTSRILSVEAAQDLINGEIAKVGKKSTKKTSKRKPTD